MSEVERDGLEAQRRFDELNAKMDANRADIEALQAQARGATERAKAGREHTDAQNSRIDGLEARADVDRELIAVLQAEGHLSHEHAVQLEQALRTSRKIGAAIGIVMVERKLNEEDAFDLLKHASQDANRKLRDIADELVRTGDVSRLEKAP